mmetsp:Transcript_33394/g.37998  ORF Transcript_33394/g.37998 Transcript_33394/m.37998 type:complete len:239 (+) Transcript_33394:102-818(+)|eukprot:CAMPEP_0194145908 /NCGR_PEP_ID=MMETSP0152-20130528/18908_1 /TAXON_ID=1049557 /ORGANISM="Thalassiothrix antarctica, Strain L6-D1" /LENGTH=238 /DNA_ID=CAMNT_0038846277 /DNA_START=63 /DNA_END=779 /DNA_ORIENTATION=-
MRQILALIMLAYTVAFSPLPITTRAKMAIFSSCQNDDSYDIPDNKRRSWITSAISAATTVTLFSSSSAVADEKFNLFQDKSCDFQISIPATWEKSEQTLSDRRSITFFIDPSSGEDKNLFFAALTPIRDDFTSLSSFGSVAQVAQTTILPRGEINLETTKSVMLNAESKKNAYFFDYKVTPPNQPETHYRTIFYLAQGATGGAGSVLATMTAQCPESRYGELKPLFNEIIDSFGKYEA